ncbi:MAG: hypothetical protein H0V78_09525 [Burkholderiales bacterium]|nr:hypothetical protein [Burkholderiales bacterium]
MRDDLAIGVQRPQLAEGSRVDARGRKNPLAGIDSGPSQVVARSEDVGRFGEMGNQYNGGENDE